MPIITYPNIIFPIATTETKIISTGKRHVGYELIPQLRKDPNPHQRDTSHITEMNYIEPVPDYAISTHFPIGGPTYRLSTAASARGGVQIQPWMHITSAVEDIDIGRSARYANAMKVYNAEYLNNMKFAYQPNAHYHSTTPTHPDKWNDDTLGAGLNDSLVSGYPVEFAPGAPNTPAMHINLYPYNANNRPLYQFRGAMTEINPQGNGNPEKQKILDEGLESYDKWLANVDSTNEESMASPETPTSPIHPFTRVHPNRAHHAIITSYNRTRLPIADIEHRKSFQYIFITRPECYLMSSGDRLCMQAEYDEDISSVYARMPYVIKALSPVYVSGNSAIGPRYANWNYLLCNRVLSIGSPGGNTLSVVDSMTKAVRGATVTPGKLMTGNLGGTLEVTFRDTKYMEVYEMIRSWMWYIHKRKIGKFFPPFNGYEYSNNFANAGYKFNGLEFNRMHPYDRALEYCCSLWNVITDETGQNILYWCKYYGLYPTQVTTPMLSGGQNGAAINGDATVSTQFQYQYKRENVFKNLVEFNFNAGIVDSLGNMRSDVALFLTNTISHLNKENENDGVAATSNVLKKYNGAASMFTGSPFIISNITGAQDPWTGKGNSSIVKSQLCFVPVEYVDEDINRYMNLRITNASRVSGDMFF